MMKSKQFETKNVFLSRAAHDVLLDNAGSRRLLRFLFKDYARKWSLGGVTFLNVNPVDRISLEARGGVCV